MESQPPITILRPLKKRTVIIAINGIRTANDPDAWPRHFDQWVDTNMDDGIVAERFEYTCSASLRFWGQRKRVDQLLLEINRYKNDERFDTDIVLVGHSNGCDIVQRILNLGIHVREIHLFSPAAHAEDFARAIESHTFKRMFIYGSSHDEWLTVARDSRLIAKAVSFVIGLFRFPPIGYGWLGLEGAEFASKYPGIVKDCSINSYLHGTWFDDNKFEGTMRLFQANYLSSQTTPPNT